MLALLAWVPVAFASLLLGNGPPPSTGAGHGTAAEPPAGSPELGVLLIIGVVAALVFMAWLLSRVGDDSPRDDGTII